MKNFARTKWALVDWTDTLGITPFVGVNFFLSETVQVFEIHLKQKFVQKFEKNCPLAISNSKEPVHHPSEHCILKWTIVRQNLRIFRTFGQSDIEFEPIRRQKLFYGYERNCIWAFVLNVLNILGRTYEIPKLYSYVRTYFWSLNDFLCGRVDKTDILTYQYDSVDTFKCSIYLTIDRSMYTFYEYIFVKTKSMYFKTT